MKQPYLGRSVLPTPIAAGLGADTDTGEVQEKRLAHPEEAEKYYRDLAAQRMQVRVGVEASGRARWFERLLGELQLELWIGDAAEIRTRRVRKQKTGRHFGRASRARRGGHLHNGTFIHRTLKHAVYSAKDKPHS